MVQTGKALVGASGRIVDWQSEREFMKVAADAGREEILGTQLMCEYATDIMGEFVVAIITSICSIFFIMQNSFSYM